MARPLLLLSFVLAIIGCFVDAAVVEHTFRVGNMSIERLGQRSVITAVNEQLPGPKIEAREGDTVIVHVINQSPYGITMHWHGIFQRLTSWADGPNMVSQCPIRPGSSYTYHFNITGQEGTLWWHAHVSFLRATVHGALLVRPRQGPQGYPFPMPHKELTILLGEWWNSNVVNVERQAVLTGGPANNSDAITINGKLGNLYNNSKEMYKVTVEHGKTYLLRLINAALNYQLFFKVAGHCFTVVAVDASYTNPYETDTIVIAPGQTVDALMHANASPGRYYMAAQVYESIANATYSTTTRGLVEYKSASPESEVVMLTMPAFNDSRTAQSFYSSLTGLVEAGKPTVPLHVDAHMFVTYGLGIAACQPRQTLCNQTRGSLAASMNNVSFEFPTKMSLLEAHIKKLEGVYTADFPDKPPVFFDFTNASVNTDPALAPLMFTSKGTKVKKVKFNSTVEMVLQNTAILGSENHPLHLHGFNFYVVAQGEGNYNAHKAVGSYNLINPQVRNTIAVPAGGWAVMRFTADNPGVWIMHCHLDAHLPFGLAMAFEVEDGPTPDTVLPPPPPDYPQCWPQG